MDTRINETFEQALSRSSPLRKTGENYDNDVTAYDNDMWHMITKLLKAEKILQNKRRKFIYKISNSCVFFA